MIKKQMIKKIFNNESLIVLLYTAISMVGALVIMKILVINLTKEHFGIYSLVLSIMAFVTIFPFKGLDQANARYVSINRNQGTFTEYYSNYFILFLLIIIVYPLIFIVIDILNIKLGIFTQYLWFIFYFLISEVIKITLRTIIGADRKRIQILISYSIEICIKIVILFILATDITIQTIFLLFIFANILSSIKLFLENKDDIKIKAINFQNFTFHNKRLWFFSYPFIIMATFTWFRDMSNRWIIDMYLDKESVAIYSILTSIAIIIPAGLQTTLGSYLVPIIYQKENTQKGFARKVTNILLMVLSSLFALVAIFIYIFSDELIILFSSSKYIYESWALTYLFLAFSIYTLAMFSVYEILAKNNSKKLIVPSIISGVLSVVSGLVLIKYYGLNGAIYSYMVGYISYAIFIFIAVLKYRRRNDIN